MSESENLASLEQVAESVWLPPRCHGCAGPLGRCAPAGGACKHEASGIRWYPACSGYSGSSCADCSTKGGTQQVPSTSPLDRGGVRNCWQALRPAGCAPQLLELRSARYMRGKHAKDSSHFCEHGARRATRFRCYGCSCFRSHCLGRVAPADSAAAARRTGCRSVSRSHVRTKAAAGRSHPQYLSRSGCAPRSSGCSLSRGIPSTLTKHAHQLEASSKSPRRRSHPWPQRWADKGQGHE
jgi:hypothetical protein